MADTINDYSDEYEHSMPATAISVPEAKIKRNVSKILINPILQDVALMNTEGKKLNFSSGRRRETTSPL